MNGDGYKDLIAGERDGFVNLFERMKDGSLKPGVRIKANGTDIRMYNNSSPEVVDWNEDGLFDLLVGGYPEREGVRLYLNSGTKTEYKFIGFTKMSAGGSPIEVPYPYLQVVDFNNDGKKDLLVGTGGYESSPLLFYENIGTNAAPVLAKGINVYKKDGKPVVGYYSFYFCIADWNNDGAYDIVWTESPDKENIHLYLGEATTSTIPPDKASRIKKLNNSRATHEKLFIDLNLEYDQVIDLSIFSFSGALVGYMKTGLLRAGDQKISIAIKTIPNGFYCVRYVCNHKWISQKLPIIQ